MGFSAKKALIPVLFILLTIAIITGCALGKNETRNADSVNINTVPDLKRTLRFDENDEFRLLIFSDLRISDAIEQEIIASVENIVDTAEPSLVLFGGDVHDGSVDNEQELRAVLDALNAPLESRGIPWCHTFGVDAEGTPNNKTGFSKEAQMAVYQSYAYCISASAGEDVYGVSNYVVPVRYAGNDAIGFCIWCLDSNGYLNDYVPELESQVLPGSQISGNTNLDCIHFTQRLWYWDTSVSIEKQNGNAAVPGIMYFQVPPYQFKYITENPGVTGMTGSCIEPLSASERDSGIVWTCCERGDIKGIFCGFNEKNDYSGTYLDMLFACCSSVGNGSDPDTAGARLITVTGNGTNMESSMVYASPKIAVDTPEIGHGDKLEISYSGITGKLGKNVEIRLYNKNAQTPGVDRSAMYCALTDANGDLIRGFSGTVLFPNDDGRGSTDLPAGEYVAKLIDGVNRQIGDSVPVVVKSTEIYVENPSIYTVEKLEIGYLGITGSLGANVEVRLYNKNAQTPGVDRSAMYCALTDQSGALLRGSSGIVVFPDDDGRGSTELSAGEYVVKLINGANRQIGDSISVVVTDNEIFVENRVIYTGQELEICYENISEAYGSNLEIRLYKKSAQRPGIDRSAMYCILTDSNGELLRGSSGTVVFPNDDGRGSTVIPAGEYVVKLIDGQNRQVNGSVEVTVKDTEFSVRNTELNFGDDLVIDFAGISSYFGRDLEVRLYRQDAALQGTDPSVMYFALTDSNGTPTRGLEFSVSFPADDARNNAVIPAGEYALKILNRYNNQIGNTIKIKVNGGQEMSVARTHIFTGEDLLVNYSSIVTELGPNLEMRLYRKGQSKPGVNPSVMYFTLTDASGNLTRGSSGTVSFPADDARNSVAIEPGTYELKLVNGRSYQIGYTLEITVLEKPQITSASLTLSDSIAVNFKVSGDNVDLSKYEMYIDALFLENNYILKPEYDETNNVYVFRFTDIAPDQMKDIITASLKLRYRGTEETEVADTVEYSIAEYCYDALSLLTDNDAELRTLIVDILKYGEKAQLYTGHNTDDLATAELTAGQLAWATAETPSVSVNTEISDIDGAVVNWKGAGLNLIDTISVRLKFRADNIDGMYLEVRNSSGSAVIIAVDSDSFDRAGSSSDTYYAYFRLPNPACIFTDYEFRICDSDGDPVSGTLTYSAASYAASMLSHDIEPELEELIRAMLIYGNSVRAFVNANS